MMNNKITAPIVALMIEEMMPPPIAMPRAPSTQVPMNAPTMPTMILPIRPKPTPLTITPASQPAMAPMMMRMINASNDMASSPKSRPTPEAAADHAIQY